MSRATLSDELWVEVKSLSSLVIAGSPRNIFRYSAKFKFVGGRALDGFHWAKARKTNQTPNSGNVFGS